MDLVLIFLTKRKQMFQPYKHENAKVRLSNLLFVDLKPKIELLLCLTFY
jgi:hypothetical protein